jgi:hypothetical protein
MRGLQEGVEKPYNFHMYVMLLVYSLNGTHRVGNWIYRCWTLNREEKLKYFKLTQMWYLSDRCTLEDLINQGTINEQVKLIDRNRCHLYSLSHTVSHCCTMSLTNHR